MIIKKFAAVILAASMLLTVTGAAKAADEPLTEPIAETTAVSEPESETTQAAETTTVPTDGSEEITENTDAAAEMSICMRTTGFPAYFHVWIYVHNISGETLKVGPYELPAGEGVSVGSWGMSVNDSWGIYYNLEAFASRNRTPDDYYSITKEISLQDFEKVSEEIAKWNYWGFFFNCTVFACRVWNCVGEKTILPIPFPLITLLQMAIQGAERGALEMFVPDVERVYKQAGSGSEATLEKIEERSIDSFGASVDG